MKQTFYEVLGVAADASPSEIEAAWRKALAADTADAEARNRIVFARHAFETLSDPQARQRYDESLQSPTLQVFETVETVPARSSSLKGIGLFLLAAGVAAYWTMDEPERSAPAPAAAAQPHAAAAPPDETVVVAPAEKTVQLLDRLAPATTTTTTTTVSLRRELVFDGANGALLSKAVKSVFKIAGPAGAGTGVMVAKDRLLTNCHVLVPNANAGRMAAIDPVTGTAYPIPEVGWVKYRDACVAYAPGLPGTPIGIGNSGQLGAGDLVFNVGYPGGTQLTASEGSFVRTEERGGQNFLVTSNFCQPGSSGGPLLDANGNLIGLVTGGRMGGDKACLSLTVETAMAVMSETLMPLGMLPRNYESNVTSPLDRR